MQHYKDSHGACSCTQIFRNSIKWLAMNTSTLDKFMYF